MTILKISGLPDPSMVYVRHWYEEGKFNNYHVGSVRGGSVDVNVDILGDDGMLLQVSYSDVEMREEFTVHDVALFPGMDVKTLILNQEG